MKKLLTCLSFLGSTTLLQAQVGIGTATPNGSAQLEITSSSKGLLIPRMMQTNRSAIISPATGLLVYQTDAPSGFYYYDGAAWQQLGNAWSLAGNTIGVSDFIGTLNSQPLRFKLNGIISGEVSPSTFNNGLGYQVFKSLTTGVQNTAFGGMSLSKNASGIGNTAVGMGSMINNTSGSNNTAIGLASLNVNTTGNNNIGIGINTLTENTIGSNNIAIGYQAGPGPGYFNLNNSTAIGYMAAVNQSNSLILGGTGANAVQVGIGTSAPHSSAQMEIAGTKGLLIPRMTQSNLPSSPATGLLIFQTDNTPGFYYYDGVAWQQLGASGWGLNGNTGITTTNFWGTTDDVALNIKVNSQSGGFISNSSATSTFLGYQAGGATNLLNNTFYGYQAGYNNNLGNNNTSVGYKALYNNSADGNVAIGNLALGSNNSGADNTAFGGLALFSNSIGHDNAAVGKTALQGNTSGNYNTAIGVAALTTNIFGSNNTAVGYNAGPNVTSLNNSTAIGNSATTTASNQVRIGNTLVTSIGGQVGWTTLSDVRFKRNIQPENHGLDFIMALQPVIYNMDIKKLNQFLYGKKADSLNKDISNAQSIKNKESIIYSGFSAQQVEEVANKIGYTFSGIHKPENDRDHYSLEYAAFVVPLVKAVQEQQQIITKLTSELDSTQKGIDELRRELNILKQKIKD